MDGPTLLRTGERPGWGWGLLRDKCVSRKEAQV